MLVSMTSFPYKESRMTTWDFIIALFYHIDRQMHDIPKHPERTSGPVRWSPWGGCMPAQAWATEHSIAG